MIIQITKTRDELFLIKEMMPLWQKYADAFIFMDDRSTDGTHEYLMENKEKYNSLFLHCTSLQKKFFFSKYFCSQVKLISVLSFFSFLIQ